MTFTAGQEFHADLVDGVYVAADELGYDVVLSGVTPHRDEPRAVRTLVDDRCEGLVLIGSEMSARELGDLRSGFPSWSSLDGFAVSTPSAATTWQAPSSAWST